MRHLTTLEGPVERCDGQFSLHIPLSLTSPRFIESLHHAATIDETHVTLAIAADLAAHLGLTDGSIVAVDDRGGNFTILPLPASVDPSSGQRPSSRQWRISARRHAPIIEVGSMALFSECDESR